MANGNWRALEAGGKYAPWVRELAEKNGVYLIRRKGSRKVLYVGHSRTGRLKKTLQRHFQEWNDEKYHFTTGRRDVEVRVIFTASGRAALEMEHRLIAKLKPEGNRQGVQELEEAPF